MLNDKCDGMKDNSQMPTFVFLPATAPDDAAYGEPPGRLGCCPDAIIRHVRFPGLVWYNKSVQDDAIAQIRSFGAETAALIGFSKSGLGAWNIAMAIPDLASATVIFDAPVARRTLPPWGTDPFYADDDAWRQDLPILHVKRFHETMSRSHKLVLVAGPAFREEMRALSKALSSLGRRHVFLDRPDMKHHWNSGWIEPAVTALLE